MIIIFSYMNHESKAHSVASSFVLEEYKLLLYMHLLFIVVGGC